LDSIQIMSDTFHTVINKWVLEIRDLILQRKCDACVEFNKESRSFFLYFSVSWINCYSPNTFYSFQIPRGHKDVEI
jgi:hypothetical protein